MADAREAMTTWLGALGRGGILLGELEEHGMFAAMTVVGADALGELRQWFEAQTDADALRERRAAVEVCIWMAHADRDVADSERELLSQLIARSGLPADVRGELDAAVVDGLSIEGIEHRLTQETLRTLMLALAWELAEVDRTIDPRERASFDELAAALGVDEESARAIEAAVRRSSED